MSQQPLDHIPLLGVFIACIGITLLFYELGYRIGRWREQRSTGEISGPTGMIVGSILALMAFLLAIATGMAADRFDARCRRIRLPDGAAGMPGHGFVANDVSCVADNPGRVVDQALAADVAGIGHEQDRAGGQIVVAVAGRIRRRSGVGVRNSRR